MPENHPPPFAEAKEFDTADLPCLLSYTQSPVILEIGAHKGTETQLFAEMFPSAAIFAFEPDPLNLAALQRRNLPANVSILPKAVSDRTGCATFHRSSTSYSGSVKKPKNHLHVFPDVHFEKTFEVQTIRLDEFCAQQDIQRVDFIWAGAQGAEQELLVGMS